MYQKLFFSFWEIPISTKIISEMPMRCLGCLIYCFWYKIFRNQHILTTTSKPFDHNWQLHNNLTTTSTQFDHNCNKVWSHYQHSLTTTATLFDPTYNTVWSHYQYSLTTIQCSLTTTSKPDGAATESSLNKERIVRNSSCQEFWNFIDERWEVGH